MNNRIILFFIATCLGLQVSVAQTTKPALSWQDIPEWEYIRFNAITISNDGKWYAYAEGPTEGDLQLLLRSALDTNRYSYPIGGDASNISFNEQSSHVAFLESPKYKDIKANEKSRRPSHKKLRLVTLRDTSSVTFEQVNAFRFSNENSEWLAIRFAPNAPAAPGARNTEGPKGSDLLLYNIHNKQSFNIGNVNEFQFNKNGQYLVYTVDANLQNGNGVFIRDMQSGMTYALDNDKATYSKINWNKEGSAFALLKSKKEKDYKNPVYSLIGVKDINGNNSTLVSYTGLDENQITAGFGISENSTPYWSKDLNTIFFGIAKLEKNEDKKEKDGKEGTVDKDSVAHTETPIDSTAIAEKPARGSSSSLDKKDLEKPDMIIWNWQDKRLQSAQRTQLTRDKNYTILSALDTRSNQFLSLADSSIRSVALAPNNLVGYGFDYTPYELESNLDGQRFADLYIVDIGSGDKTLVVEKMYLNASRGISFSPDSKYLLYYQDGDYHILDMVNGTKTNLTQNIPTSFIASKVDNNVDKPGTPNFGWTADSKFVLLRDNFDLWKVSPNGKSITPLTNQWKDQQWLVQRIINIYPDDDDTDLKKDQYFAVFNDQDKNAGIALLKSGSNKLEILTQSADIYGFVNKPKAANTLFFSKQNSTKSPELYVADNNDLSSARQLTENTPTQEKFAFSSGVKLIEYVNDFGDTLQATLFLPANYVEGQSYPTITYIYERLTDGTNAYTNPAFPGGGFNRAIYNSNGYAVLMPDIVYKLNDPGMSAVACVVPAVKAAIATGIVDEDRVGIQGHSWGGYQTSFLITQTDIFKAAVAGAPLTNMISMYSLIYWNSGSTNQSIFESSQGRLTTGYWDNWDAYTRNSPIYHIKSVNTPLVIMHNDKDGAVDYTQGIEYFNGLRRLSKPVVMLTYNGENHGLVKDVNKKDYAVRMMEFFDHYLKDSNSPDWWEKGVDYMDMEKHLEERAF